MNMRFSKIIVFFISILIGSVFVFSSCTKEDEAQLNNIVGSWYGIRSYYNPVGGTKYQYLTFRFYDNYSGEYDYETPVSYEKGYFSYQIKGSKIVCKGAIANSYGDVDADFTLNLKIEGDRLLPQEKYSAFILTKDGSVETDGNGNEVIDNSELIYGVWLHSSDEFVLVLNNSTYTEYTLLSPSSNIYAEKAEGPFSYDYRQNYILVNGIRFNILTLTESELKLKAETSGNIYAYKRGTEADIPSNGNGSEDYRTFLELPSIGWKDSSRDRFFVFHHSNQVYYSENSSKMYGSWGYISLVASGTYWIEGKEINCVFDNVSWQDGKSGSKNYFPDWICGETNFKVFTIESIDTEKLKLKFENGKSYSFYP